MLGLFGLARRGSQQLREQAARLRLPFGPLPEVPDSIWWQEGPPLQRLADAVGGYEQVLITAAVESDVPAALAAHTVRIRAGRVLEAEEQP